MEHFSRISGRQMTTTFHQENENLKAINENRHHEIAAHEKENKRLESEIIRLKRISMANRKLLLKKIKLLLKKINRLQIDAGEANASVHND